MPKKWPKIVNNYKISEITKYGDKITKIDKNVKKMPKTSQKRPKNGQSSKKQISLFFWLETTSKNWYSGLKQLKMDLNDLKCIKIHIPQKGPNNAQKWEKNGNKCQKTTNNCKISEINKYGEKITTNLQKCQTM